jgi:hypothetical protein
VRQRHPNDDPSSVSLTAGALIAALMCLSVAFWWMVLPVIILHFTLKFW